MIGGTAGHGALPPAALELDLDLSDLRRALLSLRDRTSLASGLGVLTSRVERVRIPWARCGGQATGAARGVTLVERGGQNRHGTGNMEADGGQTAALPVPAIDPLPGAARPVGDATSGPAPVTDPHPTNPRPTRPSSRALRNPAPRRPSDAESGSPVPVVRPAPETPNQLSPSQSHPSQSHPSQGGPGHDGSSQNRPPEPPGPPSPEHRNRVPGSRRESTHLPAGSDGEDVWTLVRQAQNGDAQAFARIYDRYFDTVYRYISYRIGSRTVAEDLTSEVWLRALRRIGSVSWQGRDLGAWLVTIARNLIADHYKSGRQRLEVTTADMLDADDVAPGPEGHPEAAVLTRLNNATLLDTVQQLNPEQQECITLRFLQGLSVTETAQIMGKNDGAIKALQYRAVRTLGRLLPEGFTP